MSEKDGIDFTALAAPFAPDDIDWRPGATNQAKTQALALGYITARAVMDRLDDVCGPANWRDEYLAGPAGGVLCRLSIRIDGEWVTKEDAAEATAVEPIKGGISDALKRAAVKWGIGRYLYDLPAQWVAYDDQKRRLTGTPQLPEWAGGHGATDHHPQAPQRPAWYADFRAALTDAGLIVKDCEPVVQAALTAETYAGAIQHWLDAAPGRTVRHLVSLAADMKAATV